MNSATPYNCLVVLGPTASGKTRLACLLAYHLQGEIISADSRQVYKHLNIGSGKDLEEYEVKGQKIPYHLIDMVEPEDTFFLHQFAEQLHERFLAIQTSGALPIVCGGTGLYLDALQKDFAFTQIKENPALREDLALWSKDELRKRLQTYPQQLWQHVDLDSKKRLIRGIEIVDHLHRFPGSIEQKKRPYKPFYLGLTSHVEQRREKIAARLQKRLNEGLIDEVRALLDRGLTHERLEYFGLEYKFVSRYLRQLLSREELQQQLQTAIFQFAKRQMTWFRKMEKEGVPILWIDPALDLTTLLSNLEKLGFVRRK